MPFLKECMIYLSNTHFFLLCSQVFSFLSPNFHDLYFQNTFSKKSATETNNEETFENIDLFYSLCKRIINKTSTLSGTLDIHLHIRKDRFLFSLGKIYLKNGVFKRIGFFILRYSSILKTYTKYTNYKINHDIKLDYLPKLRTLI